VRRAIDVLTVAVAGGVAAGLVHAIELLVTARLRHELVFFSREFVWMAPIAYSVVFLVPAIGLAAIASVTGRRWVPAVALFLTSLLAVFGVLLPYSQIARIAALALAAGAAVQVTRSAMPSLDVWLPRARRFVVAGITAAATLGTISSVRNSRAEARALGAYPAAPEGAPNVLLLVLDTVRASALGLYGGDPATTPALARWARDGVRFEWAMAVAPWTLPSHASMFTGKYPAQLSATWRNALDARDSTLAEVFLTRGYATGGFVGNMHYTSWESGLPRGFATYEDYLTSPRQTLRSSSYTQTRWFDRLAKARSRDDFVKAALRPNLSVLTRHTFDRKPATEVASRFLDWQAQLGRRPFFAFLNFFDAHDPYSAPEKYRHFAPAVADFHEYQAALAYLDASIDSILTTLRARGALDNTIVIVTSDHGEHFKEHGLVTHGNSLYVQLLHVPLIIRYPKGVPAGATVRETVSLRDLAATILDLSGAGSTSLPGRSLRAFWAGAPRPDLSPVMAEMRMATNVEASNRASRGNMWAILNDSVHYIKNGDRVEELFAYRTDPLEEENLAIAPDGAGRTTPWRTHLDSLRRVFRR
jgi:arylsulfatase A-like enzyme